MQPTISAFLLVNFTFWNSFTNCTNSGIICEISGSLGGEYEDYLLAYSAV
jgi:hypothetical protein